MISLDVVLDHYLWKKKIKNPQNYIKKRLIKLSKISFFKKKSKNLTILLTKNKKMKMLNKKFRKKNKSTDVLSFPFNKKKSLKKNEYLGDIAISYEIIDQRSKYSNFIKEFDKIWVHGYLHLLGYSHKKKKDFIKMEKLENLVLNYFYK
ncbi:rRNA maturation RNase YbeY [Candidatus Pelagibacter sp.]|nr:rRNA maturation RNase YbeY [Candidatus Pelagibacter sp.]